MLDDFTAIVHNLDGRTVKLYAVADVHIGARECDLDGFAAFLKRVQADKDAYLVLCGDVVNNGIKDSLTSVYEETLPPHAQIELAAELLRPVAGRILGCVGGNHEARSKKAVDLDPMYQVMVMIGKPELYRPNMAFVRVNLLRGNTRAHYSLLLVHGKTANKRRQFAYAVEGVDAIISAHTHDGGVERPARLVFTKSNNVLIKPLVSVVATSWLRFGGYAAAGLMLPKDTSRPQALLLEFTGSNNKIGQIRVIW